MLRPIGFIESCFREKFGTPRQGALVPEAPARLRIRPEFLPEHSLLGLEEFSHVWLVFRMHLNTQKAFRPKIHPPRLRGKTIGVFASRSPHRPNSIGLTLARLERIQGDTLHLAGVDLVNGTPVLDIKPYLNSSDRPRRARCGWAARCREPRLEVGFTAGALAQLRRAVPAAQRALVRRLILRSLSRDPRNPRDRAQMRPGKELLFFVLHYDVRFRIRGRRVRVFSVAPEVASAHDRPPLRASF